MFLSKIVILVRATRLDEKGNFLVAKMLAKKSRLLEQNIGSPLQMRAVVFDVGAQHAAPLRQKQHQPPLPYRASPPNATMVLSNLP